MRKIKRTARQQESNRIDNEEVNRVKMISRKLTELLSSVIVFELGFSEIKREDIHKLNLQHLLEVKTGLRKIIRQLKIK